MLSCIEICKVLSKFEGEEPFKLDHYNPLFEQSPTFSKNYLQLVEDKIKENSWVDPNLDPEQFNENKQKKHPSVTGTGAGDEETNQSVNMNVGSDNGDSGDSNGGVFLNYKEHQTGELPKVLLDMIDKSRHAEIYYYGMKGPDSFLGSVLLGAEENYWLQHRKKKKEYADQVKTTFSIQKYDILRGLSKESIGQDYLSTIYSNDFPEHIDSDKSKEFRFLIGYHYKINILVLELKDNVGHFVTDWRPELPTLVLLLDNQLTYLPILSNKNSSYFTQEEVKALKFNILYPTKLKISNNNDNGNGNGSGSSHIGGSGNSSCSENTNTNTNELGSNKKGRKKVIKEHMISSVEQIDLKTITVEQIYPIAKYQLKDLQDIAEKLNLQLEITKYLDDKSMRIIKKTKKDLYEDIINKITKLGNQ